MYKLLFIDEEKKSLEHFEDYVDGSRYKEELHLLTQYPLRTIDEMIEHITKVSPDALIVDHVLNEKKADIFKHYGVKHYNIDYNGAELVMRFQEIRANFPCFILTAVDDRAIEQSDDVNVVYIKEVMHHRSITAKTTFLDKVIRQIEHYKSKIENAQNELQELLRLRQSGRADIKTEERIIELDNFLEKSIDARASIPPELKTLSLSSKLDSIIEKMDSLLGRDK